MKFSCLNHSSAAIGIAAAGVLLLQGCKNTDATADAADTAAGDASALMGDAAGPVERPTPSGPPTRPVPYTVQSGDSLWKISRQYNVSMGDIANANNMAVADTLVAGRTITIPVPEDAATTPPETAVTPTIPETTTPTPEMPVTPAIPETTTPGFGTDSLGTRPSRLVVPPEPSPSTPVPGLETPSTPVQPRTDDDGFQPLGGN